MIKNWLLLLLGKFLIFQIYNISDLLELFNDYLEIIIFGLAENVGKEATLDVLLCYS